MKRWTGFYLRASPREQVLLVVTALVFVVLVYLKVVWEPLWQRQQVSRDNLDSLASDLRALATERDALVAAAGRDLNALQRSENEALRKQVKAQQERLGVGLKRLVAPEEMRDLLAGLLAEHSGLQLREVSKLPAMRSTGLASESATAQRPASQHPASNSSGAESEVVLFNHRLRMIVRGGFLDTLRYIRHVETHLPRLRLVAMDLRVTSYPLAEVLLEWETLGIDARWLGVQ